MILTRYALIREMDISNGEGVGVSLFVQGCHFHCPGCFNQETWDFNGGKEWTEEIENKFFELIDKPYIKRVSILGGEPLANENRYKVFLLCQKIKNKFSDKKIWIYSGYTYEEIIQSRERSKPLLYADVLVDGQFRLDLQDINNKQINFAGSINQRIIDVQESLQQNKIIIRKR